MVCSGPGQIATAGARCIPTAQWGHPMCTPVAVRRFVAGLNANLLTDLGWRSVGVLERTAVPGIDQGRWVPWVEEADVLIS